MAYTPTEWECGDVVTAEKLNNIEEGIQEALESGGGGAEPLVVHEDGDTYTLDKTWQEIYDAYPNVAIYTAASDGVSAYTKSLITEVKYDHGEYSVKSSHEGDRYATDDADGYPVYIEGQGLSKQLNSIRKGE